MVRRIRDDLTGRVLAHSKGHPVWLEAGQQLPRGVQVSENLLEPEVTTDTPATGKRGGRRASSKQ